MTAVFVTSAENKLLYELFSDPYLPAFDDIVAVGGSLEPDLLIHAYDHGIFPWPHEGYPLLWFSPEQRGVLDFSDLHEPRSFKKWRRQHESELTVTFDQNFSDVVKHCRNQPRPGQQGSWINDEIESAYAELFKIKKAFSVEIKREGRLVGGIYGVRSRRYCSCESMFHLEDHVSKLALVKLIEKLKAEGETWMDIQMVTSVSEVFGGKLVSKNLFLKRLGF